jgi:hypothetical protein
MYIEHELEDLLSKTLAWLNNLEDVLFDSTK